MPEQFRVTVFGDPRAPWRAAREEAMQDAISLDLASWDRSKREWFLAVPVDIERSGRRDDIAPSQVNHHGEPWMTDHIAQLRARAQAGEGASTIALRLGRSGRAIRAKARELGIIINVRKK